MQARSWRLSSLIALSCAAAFLRICASAQQVAQPFYLERGVYETQSSAPMVLIKREIIARRGDGTTVFIEPGLTENGAQVAPAPLRKLIEMDGSAVWLLDALRLKTTWPKMERQEAAMVIRQISRPLRNCGVDEGKIVGHETVAGQDTIVFVDKINERRELKIRIAPDLGCEALRFTQTAVRSDGSPSLASESRILHFKLGEPDARLFDTGDGYTEVTEAILTARRNGWEAAPDATNRATAQRVDDQYIWAVAGVWTGRLTVRQSGNVQYRDITLTLRADGARLTGTFAGTWEGRSDSTELLDGKMSVDGISFEIATGASDVPRFKLTGTPHDDELKLSISMKSPVDGSQWVIGDVQLNRRN